MPVSSVGGEVRLLILGEEEADDPFLLVRGKAGRSLSKRVRVRQHQEKAGS